MNYSLIYQGNFTHPYFTKQLNWLFPVIISGVLLLMTIWILLSLVIYGIKEKVWKQNRNRNSNFDKLNRGLIFLSVVACALACVICLAFSTVFINIGFKEDEHQMCNIMFGLVGSSYGAVLWTSYVFLWLRQRTFYINKMLNVNYTKAALFLSTASIVAITVFGLSAVVFASFPNDQFATDDGCEYRPHKVWKITYWALIAFTVCFGHVILFCLLAYALKTANDTSKFMNGGLRKSSKRLNCQKKNDNGHENGLEASPSNRPTISSIRFIYRRSKSSSTNTLDCTYLLIKSVLQKTLIFASVSATNEIVLQCLLYFSDLHSRVITTLFNISILMNLLFVIFSFVHDKKKMMFAPIYCFVRKS